ncbi:AmmeMemoRadiSam system protein A [Candidatus Woesearchaeota archaeon]|nr:AmmeMemoRadiSam system protein A [Candidatus Woesearchaeota archaeon]
MKLTKEDGKSLIKLARDAISSAFKDRDLEVNSSLKEKYSEKRGAFVTLTIEGELRGCIGYTEALFPLWETVTKAAQSAAFQDPRFNPLTEEEFRDVKIEISVLTKPELIEGDKKDYAKKIEIGKHGLVVETGFSAGLLLPQVFTEYNADAKKALEMTCQKAGLPSGAWQEKDCRVYRFSAQIFIED